MSINPLGKGRRRWLRFSAWTLMFVVACIAGILAGYRNGYRTGWQAAVSAHDRNLVVVRVYPVVDLINNDPATKFDANDLAKLIVTTIAPKSWSDASGLPLVADADSAAVLSFGGFGTIDVTENSGLVIAQLPEHHGQIAKLLDQLHTLSRTAAAR